MLEVNRKINKLKIELDNIKQLQIYLKHNLVFLEQIQREKSYELLNLINTEKILNQIEKRNK